LASATTGADENRNQQSDDEENEEAFVFRVDRIFGFVGEDNCFARRMLMIKIADFIDAFDHEHSSPRLF